MGAPAMKLTASAFTPNAKPFTPGGMGKPAPVAKPREPTPPRNGLILKERQMISRKLLRSLPLESSMNQFQWTFSSKFKNLKLVRNMMISTILQTNL